MIFFFFPIFTDFYQTDSMLKKFELKKYRGTLLPFHSPFHPKSLRNYDTLDTILFQILIPGDENSRQPTIIQEPLQDSIDSVVEPIDQFSKFRGSSRINSTTTTDFIIQTRHFPG